MIWSWVVCWAGSAYLVFWVMVECAGLQRVVFSHWKSLGIGWHAGRAMFWFQIVGICWCQVDRCTDTDRGKLREW